VSGPAGGITVCIPSIPPRAALLQRALHSVLAQTLPAAALSVALDHHREGAAVTRTRAVAAARTEWVALLDDDDQLYPQHLAALAGCAAETGADYVYGYFDVIGGLDPLNSFGEPFNPAAPKQTTTTILVRTDLAQACGWVDSSEEALIHGQRAGEDYRFTLACLAKGARIVHHPERTWAWSHHGGNTSGQPDRW
jgi:glycosyltransferase involved in cell wall biosynthesis